MIIFHYVASAMEYQYDNSMIREVWAIAWDGKCDSGSKYEGRQGTMTVTNTGNYLVEANNDRIKHGSK